MATSNSSVFIGYENIVTLTHFPFRVMDKPKQANAILGLKWWLEDQINFLHLICSGYLAI